MYIQAKAGGSICLFLCASDGSSFKHYRQLAMKAYSMAQQGNLLLIALSIGDMGSEKQRCLIDCGVDVIYICKSDAALSKTEMVDAIEKMLQDIENVKLVIFPSTPTGEEVAARLSVRIDVGLTADCTDIYLEYGRFIYKRTALNSSIVASIVTQKCTLGMCTVKMNVVLEGRVDTANRGAITSFLFTPTHKPERATRLLERLPREIVDLGLDKAKVVFGAGRGLSGDALALLEKAAEKHGAWVAATRPLVESGLYAQTRQIGQSGCSIAPDLYVAFGISGACQHMIGVLNAKTIVSVNIDTDAPISQFADYCIVADATSILKLLA